jgi:2-haloacid dehalogenase
MTNRPIIVFDLGGVLIDWDPRHLYRKLFDDAEAMEQFLAEICHASWNAEQDRGRSWADAVAELAARHPEHRALIEAYHLRWEEMLGGPIEGTVAILAELKAAGRPLHALTNWSHETFPIARARYSFLAWFTSILVSGEERVMKPDVAIFELLLQRLGAPAEACLFIDDSAKNIEAASALGFDAIRFTGPDALRRDLAARGLLAAAA